MLRVIPSSGQFGIPRHGVNSCRHSRSTLKARICSMPTHLAIPPILLSYGSGATARLREPPRLIHGWRSA
jgi:hypothetical protein